MKENKILNIIKKNIKACAGILIILGLILEVYVFSFGIKNIAQNSKYSEVPANVVGYSPLDDGTFEEIVEYQVDDKMYKNTIINKNKETNGLGATVMIKYQNNNPNKIIWMDTGMHLLPTLLGALCLISGLLLYFKSNKKTKA